MSGFVVAARDSGSSADTVALNRILGALRRHSAVAQHHPGPANPGGGAPLQEASPRAFRMLHRLGRRGRRPQLFDAERGVLHQRGVSPQGRTALPGPDGGQGVRAGGYQAVSP